MTRRMMTLLLAVCVAVVMSMVYLPESAYADDVISLTNANVNNYLKTYNQITRYRLTTGSYRLDEDLTISNSIIPGDDSGNVSVNIDLNGHRLTGTGSNAILISGGKLTLTDSLGSGSINGSISIQSQGGLYLNGGTVDSITMKSGNIYANGGTVNGNVTLANIKEGGGAIRRSSDAAGYTLFKGKVSADIVIDSSAKFKINFDTQGGSSVSSQTALKGQFTMPAAPTKQSDDHFDYTFDGWWTAADGGTWVDDLNTLTPTGTTTISERTGVSGELVGLGSGIRFVTIGLTTLYAHWNQTVKQSYLESLENQIKGSNVRFQVSDDGYWQVSSDNGVTWTNITDGNGSGVKATGETGAQGAQGDKGDTGTSISKIEKTGSEGLVDTYKIAFSNGSTSTFTVTNGAKGDKGDTGATPQLKIDNNNYWYVSYNNGSSWTSLGVKATGEKGDTGQTGKEGVTPQLKIENGVWNVSYDSGATWTSLGVKTTGDDGVSITGVEKTGTEGQVDTYTITFSDGKTRTYTVTNGKDGETGAQGEKGEKGEKGDTGATGATGAAGKDGVSIVSVTKTASIGLVDTYTIALSNGQTSTFNVTNGKDGTTPLIKVDEQKNWVVSYDDGATWISTGMYAGVDNKAVLQEIQKLQISSSSVTSLRAAAKKKSVKLSWKAPKGISGLKYQVKYQRKGSSKWVTKGTSKKTLTIKKLAKGKSYRFKVCGYKKISGKTVYTDYDTTTWVKVKK